MVANACEQMLLNSDILSELYKQNASLAQKVQIKVSEFFAKLRQNIGKGARSKEAAWMADAMDELQEKWEAALRVAAENQIKLNSVEGTKNTATEGGDVRYSPVLDEDATVIDLSEENELKDRIGDLKGAKKYKVIRDYIIEKLGRNITFSDGQSAIIDNSDANHIAHDSADKKTAEISAVENLIQSAVAYAYDDNVEHNKFDYFKYYEAAVKFGEESFHVYFNLGRGKYDGKFHFYDLTNKIRDTARRINGVGRPRGFLPENGISKDIVSNPSEKSNPSDEKNSAVLPASALDTDAEYLKQSQKKYGDIESAAKKHFGTTDNFRIAGYVLADGTMLDFSGAHWLIGNDTDAAYVAEWREKNDIRQVDHEDIFEAFDGNNFPSDSRKEFINRGNIRISPEAPGINIASVPTAQQYSVIKELVRDNPYDTEGFYVDIEDKQKHIGKLTYTGKVNADLVVNDIKHFYETGEIREQSIVNQFHGQFSTPLGEDALDISEAEQISDEDLLWNMRMEDAPEYAQETLQEYKQLAAEKNRLQRKLNAIEADAEKKTGISAMSKRQLQAKIGQLEKQVKQAREQTKRTAAKREARLKNIDASSVIHSVADTIANERTLSRYAKAELHQLYSDVLALAGTGDKGTARGDPL